MQHNLLLREYFICSACSLFLHSVAKASTSMLHRYLLIAYSSTRGTVAYLAIYWRAESCFFTIMNIHINGRVMHYAAGLVLKASVDVLICLTCFDTFLQWLVVSCHWKPKTHSAAFKNRGEFQSENPTRRDQWVYSRRETGLTKIHG